MQRVLIGYRKGQAETQRRQPCEDEGKIRKTSTSQEKPGTDTYNQKLGKSYEWFLSVQKNQPH